MITTIKNFEWTKETRRLLYMALVLVLLMMLDSLTTYIGSTLGLEEANPIGYMIYEYSRILFYFGGTALYIVLCSLMLLVASDRPKLYPFIKDAMLFMIVIKMIPVIWNIQQILIMIEVIE